MTTPLGILDTACCLLGESGRVALESSQVLEPDLPEAGVAFYDADGAGTLLDREGLSSLMCCTFARHLLFAEERMLSDREFWAFPPPTSPSMPFGPVPSSASLGCDELLRHGTFLYDSIFVKRIGLVDGIDVGLGLFVAAPIPKGTFLGEYTGCLIHRQTEEDGTYGYALPIVDPDLVISAQHYGNLCRLINHSDTSWNSELVVVHHEGILHVVCRTVRNLEPGEQILIHYGPRYWLAESRRCVKLGPEAMDGTPSTEKIPACKETGYAAEAGDAKGPLGYLGFGAPCPPEAPTI